MAEKKNNSSTLQLIDRIGIQISSPKLKKKKKKNSKPECP